MTTISLICLILLIIPLAYFLLLALSSVKSRPHPEIENQAPKTRFILVIPAHNEGAVIGITVERMKGMNYPPELFSIHVVADHCSDNTVAEAENGGAYVYERDDGPRSGKGAALDWLFDRVLTSRRFDAVVIFDADTLVDQEFLRSMDARLTTGEAIIQGQHVIRNPEDGWFPALTWAMFLVDNRFQNLGRTNINWSAKNMGDSICLRKDVLQRFGWGRGLTDDYQLRQQLLLAGVKIAYEPAAIGYGEAPLALKGALQQRVRWLKGAKDSNRTYAKRLLVEGIRRKNTSLLDGALHAYLPSYSTVTIVSMLLFIFQSVFLFLHPASIPWQLQWAWITMLGIMILYPFFGLALERAPFKAYLAIALGPLFILWRTWLAVTYVRGKKQILWVRTSHGEIDEKNPQP